MVSLFSSVGKATSGTKSEFSECARLKNQCLVMGTSPPELLCFLPCLGFSPSCFQGKNKEKKTHGNMRKKRIGDGKTKRIGDGKMKRIRDGKMKRMREESCFSLQSSVWGMMLCIDTAKLHIPIPSEEEISTDEQQICFSTRITPSIPTPAPRDAQQCPEPCSFSFLRIQS